MDGHGVDSGKGMEEEEGVVGRWGSRSVCKRIRTHVRTYVRTYVLTYVGIMIARVCGWVRAYASFSRPEHHIG